MRGTRAPRARSEVLGAFHLDLGAPFIWALVLLLLLLGHWNWNGDAGHKSVEGRAQSMGRNVSGPGLVERGTVRDPLIHIYVIERD